MPSLIQSCNVLSLNLLQQHSYAELARKLCKTCDWETLVQVVVLLCFEKPIRYHV